MKDRYKELADTTQATTDGHHLNRAEGEDLLEAAIISVEKAAHWDDPRYFHEGMFETAVKMATLRANVALAVELRQLRLALAVALRREGTQP